MFIGIGTLVKNGTERGALFRKGGWAYGKEGAVT